MNMPASDNYEKFLNSFVAELIDSPDEQILDGQDPAAVQAKGLGLLKAAKAAAGKSRLGAAKAGYATSRSRPAEAADRLSADEARTWLATAANDSRFTLAARGLGELSDDEVIALVAKFRSLGALDEDVQE